MKQEMYNEIKQDIETLATKLDKPTKEIWRVLIRETYIQGALAAIYVLIAPIVIYFGYHWALVAHNMPLDKHGILAPEAFLSYVGAIMTIVIAIIVAVSNFSTMVSKLFNPKYSAIMDVKNILSQPKKD